MGGDGVRGPADARRGALTRRRALFDAVDAPRPCSVALTRRRARAVLWREALPRLARAIATPMRAR